MEAVYITGKESLLPYLPALRRAQVLGVDTETTGLNPHADRVRLLQLAAPGLPVLVMDCFALLPEGLEMIKEILEGPGVKIFQNAKFDLQFFMALGIYPEPLFDTMLAGQLLRGSGGPARTNLAALARHYLGEELSKDEQASDWRGDLTQAQLRYAALDAQVLPRLREVMVKELQDNGLNAIARIEFACAAAVAQMEYAGIALDQARWAHLVERTEGERERALEALYGFVGHPSAQTSLWGEDVVLGQNFDSNPYVLRLLHANGIPAQDTSRRELSAYGAHPLVQAISEYRRTAKALSAFLHPIPPMIRPQTGRLHPRYGQIGAWSGRMSCGGPNIQQIPRSADFRACFIAPPGRRLVIADYSQIELRVAAQISGDRRMIEAYRRGEDLHALTASLVSEVPLGSVTGAQRQAAKAVNFGLIYGMGAAGLAQYARQSYGVDMALEQATGFRDNFFRAYPGVADWHRAVLKDRADEQRTLSGRKFALGPNAGASALYNTPVQGTAADIMKAALGAVARRVKGSDTRIIAAVHDEILLEVDEEQACEAAAMLKQDMERAGSKILTQVPCVAEAKVADNWAGK